MSTVINIHNYEEYFLLYVDNELSAPGRKAVEAFVLANPDLAVELEMLQQVRLSDEEFVFDDKQLLYRSESQEINLSNYEEQFLLFVDNELAPGEKEKVERFVLQHPALQENFTQLKQIKLPAEQIVFRDKATLYREEKKRRVFYMSWQRVAVAAAFIGAVAITWSVLPKEKNQPQAGFARVENAGTNSPSSVNNTTSTTQGGAKLNNAAGGDNANTSTEKNLASNFTPGVTNGNSGSLSKGSNVNIVESLANNTNNTAANTNPIQDAGNTNTQLAQVDQQQKMATGETVSTDTRDRFSTVVSNTTKLPDEHMAITAANTEITGGPNNNDVQPAVYRELDINAEDEKKSLLLGSIEINKDKLRGFFRKAGSLFRSKAKADDEKTEGRSSTNTRSLK